MNLLFVNRMMGTAWGGGENYDYNLARELQQMGHRVTFLTARPLGAPPPSLPNDVEVVCFQTPYLRRYMYQLAGKIKLIPGLFAETDLRLFAWRVRQMIRSTMEKRSIDLVQTLSIPGLALQIARHGVPVTMRFPGPPAWFHSQRLHMFHRLSRTAMFSHGDTVRIFEDRFGFPIEEVPPGVHDRLFQPMDPALRRRRRADLGIRDEDFLISTVGRLIEGKGHRFLLEAIQPLAREDSRLRVLIVGDAPHRKRLEQTAGHMGIRDQVIFVGQQKRDQVAASLGISDLFCLFSGYENYSNAVLEAMSSGLPVMASRVGGFPLQVQNGENGFLVDYGDKQEFRTLALRLLNDRDLRHHLSQGARRFAGRFSWRASAERAISIYERLLAQGGPQRRFA